MTSGQETERVYACNPGARKGPRVVHINVTTLGTTTASSI